MFSLQLSCRFTVYNTQLPRDWTSKFSSQLVPGAQQPKRSILNASNALDKGSVAGVPELRNPLLKILTEPAYR